MANIGADFILGGKAIFTVANPTGEHYTFKVNRKDPDPKSDYPDSGVVFFVSLLTGPDNGSDYTYMGMVNPDRSNLWVRLTRASRYTADSKPVRVINWALGLLSKGQDLPAGYTIHHEGRCGRCGRRLTVPESVESGFGPECGGRLNLLNLPLEDALVA